MVGLSLFIFLKFMYLWKKRLTSYRQPGETASLPFYLQRIAMYSTKRVEKIGKKNKLDYGEYTERHAQKNKQKQKRGKERFAEE